MTTPTTSNPTSAVPSTSTPSTAIPTISEIVATAEPAVTPTDDGSGEEVTTTTLSTQIDIEQQKANDDGSALGESGIDETLLSVVGISAVLCCLLIVLVAALRCRRRNRSKTQSKTKKKVTSQGKGTVNMMSVVTAVDSPMSLIASTTEGGDEDDALYTAGVGSVSTGGGEQDGVGLEVTRVTSESADVLVNDAMYDQENRVVTPKGNEIDEKDTNDRKLKAIIDAMDDSDCESIEDDMYVMKSTLDSETVGE